MNPIDSMYKILIKQNGVQGKVNGVDCKFLITECQDSNTNGEDLLTISTDQPLEQGYYINIGTDTYLVIDKKTETKHYQAYNVGTIQKINHINKFVSNEVIYQCPSICTNITKGKLGIIYQSAGITEAQGVWCFITQYNDTSKKIKLGTRFIINDNAWNTTSLDHVTDEGILYVIMRLGSISTENDDLINEVADGLKIPNYAITLNSTSQNLYGTNTFQIVPTCTKNNVADSTAVVTYTSSDISIATVNSNGLVTAQSKLGTTTISAEYKGKIATLTLNVIADVYDITLNNSSASIFEGETYQLNSVCKKNNVVVSNPIITYVSSDSTIATVDSNGMITALKQGTCNIVCTYGNVSATFNLTTNLNVYTIDLSETTKSIIEGGTYQISATCKKNGTIVNSPVITYGSSNTNIATVSSTGKVTTLVTGNVDIICSYQGVNATLSITVEPKPIVHTYTIDLDSTASVIQGNTYQVVAVCKDNDVTVTNPVVTYSSSDTNIATIDSNGLVTSVNIGTCNITATYKGVSDTLSLTVNEPPHTYTIALNSTTESLGTGTTYQIVPSCTDNGTKVSSPVVSYSSSDTAIATVNSSGLVSAIASGSATITAIYEGQSAILNVTVTHIAVTTYSYTDSTGTTLKYMVANTFTCKRLIDGVADTTYTGGGLLSYTLDSTGQTLLSQSKITATLGTTAPTFQVRNKQNTATYTIHVTVKDVASGTIIVDNVALTLTP